MAALIIALFVIVVVWGYFLIPTKAGAHKSSALNFRGRQSRTTGQTPTQPLSGVTVVPVSRSPNGHGAPVPVVGGVRSGASVRRRRIRNALVTMAVISAAASLYTGSINWWLTHVGIDALLIIYFGLALQLQDTRAARAATASPSGQQASRPALRRVAGG